MGTEVTAEQLEQMILEAESPRTKCLKKCQANHIACLKAAGKDDAKKQACDKTLSDCVRLCPPLPLPG